MRKVSIYIAVTVVAVGALTAGLIITTAIPEYGIVKGKIADELSEDPIRGVKVIVDGKSTILYQSTHYQLTNIPAGEYTLKALPPQGWAEFTRKVKVQPGENRLDVLLKGDKIPDLKRIVCFAESKKEGITLEVRYVNSEGIGITEFPQLPIKIDVTLWEKIGEEGNYERGKKLFEGEIEHFWDSEAHLAKNKGFLPWTKIPVNLEDKKHAVMEIRVHLKQGDFKYIADDVKLFPESRKK